MKPPVRKMLTALCRNNFTNGVVESSEDDANKNVAINIEKAKEKEILINNSDL